MINIEDIHIGSWVHWQDNQIDPYQWFNGQVISIVKDENKYKIYTDIGGGDEFYLEELEPIQLTKDILDRNFIGNKYDTWNMQYWLNDELVILYYNPNDICICKSIDDPEYAYHDLEWLFDVNNVHTLQNILKLFGIDKELKIDQND